MTTEFLPMGTKCNIQCTYCYQEDIRKASNNSAREIDLRAMKKSAEEINEPVVLFGGEPLLAPESVIRDLFQWGLDRFGKNSIQTNGTLINSTHIKMFKEFNVNVGISVDGPGSLNDARRVGNSIEKTRDYTKHTNDVILRLLDEGISVGLIVTLHRVNASAEVLPHLIQWFRDLDEAGLANARIHALEVDNDYAEDNLVLTEEQTIKAFLALRDLGKELTVLKFDIFDELFHLLSGDDQSHTCVFQGCDPQNTAAVNKIHSDGMVGNCMRAVKSNVNYEKATTRGRQRSLVLYHTPHEYGGCQGCRFFLFCTGNCPGTAIDGDWRNRTRDCRLWMTLFEATEADIQSWGKVPLSLSPQLAELERRSVESWNRGENPSIGKLLAEIRA